MYIGLVLYYYFICGKMLGKASEAIPVMLREVLGKILVVWCNTRHVIHNVSTLFPVNTNF